MGHKIRMNTRTSVHTYIHTYIVFRSPQFLSSCFNGVERLPRRRDVPELDRAIMAASCQLVLFLVGPIEVMDTRHVGCDIARGSGRFLGKKGEKFCIYYQLTGSVLTVSPPPHPSSTPSPLPPLLYPLSSPDFSKTRLTLLSQILMSES